MVKRFARDDVLITGGVQHKTQTQVNAWRPIVSDCAQAPQRKCVPPNGNQSKRPMITLLCVAPNNTYTNSQFTISKLQLMGVFTHLARRQAPLVSCDDMNSSSPRRVLLLQFLQMWLWYSTSHGAYIVMYIHSAHIYIYIYIGKLTATNLKLCSINQWRCRSLGCCIRRALIYYLISFAPISTVEQFYAVVCLMVIEYTYI